MTAEQETAENMIARLEAVLDYIRVAEGRLAKGEIVDLSGLDRTVGAICEAVESADPVTAKKTEPLMVRLIKDLDTLAKAMQKQFAELQGGEGNC